jgi:hypothetical protein
MLLVSRSVSALLKKAGKNVRELDNQYQHDGFDILFSGQTRRARFKMSLWDHYVTMLRGDLNSASEQIYRRLTHVGQEDCPYAVRTQHQHDGFDIFRSGQTRIARYKMSLWGHYVTMSREEIKWC